MNAGGHEQKDAYIAEQKDAYIAERAAFDDVFKTLSQELNDYGENSGELREIREWFRAVREYNVPHGKKNRGMTVVTAYKHLTDAQHHTPHNLHRARVLGWCIEFLQAYFLVADDIMDHSLSRRGQPCWYRRKDVGLIAVNDSIYLNQAIYVILRRYFRDDRCYMNIMELFHEISMKTVTGQCMDLCTATVDTAPGDFTKFTMKRYLAIIKWKTAFYSFYLPVALAMCLAGIPDQQTHSGAEKILLHMGSYFQIQDDYLDCFGSEEITGKVGTDIQDNKCCWLVVKALTLVNDSQRLTLQQNYGVDCPQKIACVKQLYTELGLPALYREFEEESYGELMKMIEENCGDLPAELFVDYANKIYKRDS